MQRQKRCCNLPPVPATWTQSVLERTKKRMRKTLIERISPSSPPLLTHLVRNSHLPLSKLSLPIRRKTKINNKVSGAVEDEDRVAIPLPRVSMPASSKGKWKISPKLSVTTVIERGIIPTSAFGTQKRSQKTIISLGKLHASDWA